MDCDPAIRPALCRDYLHGQFSFRNISHVFIVKEDGGSVHVRIDVIVGYHFRIFFSHYRDGAAETYQDCQKQVCAGGWHRNQ